MSARLRLDELPEGAWAVVADYDPGMPSRDRQRLEDLGLIPQTPIIRERTAPWGDPILLRVRGTAICLRCTEASQIHVLRMQGSSGTLLPWIG